MFITTAGGGGPTDSLRARSITVLAAPRPERQGKGRRDVPLENDDTMKDGKVLAKSSSKQRKWTEESKKFRADKKTKQN